MTGIKVPCLGSRDHFPRWHHGQNLGWFLPCTPVIRSGCWFFVWTMAIRVALSPRRHAADPFFKPFGMQSMHPKSSFSVWIDRSIISSSSEERFKLQAVFVLRALFDAVTGSSFIGIGAQPMLLVDSDPSSNRFSSDFIGSIGMEPIDSSSSLRVRGIRIASSSLIGSKPIHS